MSRLAGAMRRTFPRLDRRRQSVTFLHDRRRSVSPVRSARAQYEHDRDRAAVLALLSNHPTTRSVR